MARLLQAIQKYGPRVVPGPTVPTEELAAWAAARSGVDVAAVRAVLWDLGDAVAAFNRSGASVRLQGLGRFRPTIGRAGITAAAISLGLWTSAVLAGRWIAFV